MRDGSITKDRKIHGESNVWSTAQRQKRGRGLDVDFNETMDQLAMVNSVRWYGHVHSREDGHVLRRLKLKVKGRKGGQKGHGKGRLRKKVWKLDCEGKMHLSDQNGVLV